MREEAKLERAVGALAKSKNCLWYKWVSPGNAGVPDRILIFPNGRIVFVELKDKKGQLSEMQKWHIRKLQKQSCEVRVIKSAEEARKLMEETQSDF